MNWKQLISAERLGDKKKTESSSLRSEFEVDYDRIIFSRPFRNLQDKTQVFPLPEQDFVHTRLTHSLEVSSVGRSLGKNVGAALLDKYPEMPDSTPYDFGAIAGAAALAHDVGNPPFGHAGEEAISNFFKTHADAERIKSKVSDQEWTDLITFEGNAQGFRLLTGREQEGLKLTKATLAAFTKYPCSSSLSHRDKNRKSQKKYGFFQNEKETFTELATDLGLVKLSETEPAWSRHPLGYLVEAADDICYGIIDLEDGFGLGLVTYAEARDFLADILQDKYQPEKLEKISGLKERIGVLRAVAISVLVEQCTQLFIEKEEQILSGEFDQALTDLIPAATALNNISKFSIKRIYQSRQVLEKEAAGYEVIEGLLASFVPAAFLKHFDKDHFTSKHKSIYRLLPDEVHHYLEEICESPYQAVLKVLDFVSGMTDSTALSIYRTIKGINLKGVRS